MSLTKIAAVTNSNVVLGVVMEDEPVHTAENGYYCGDSTCPCFEDSEPPCLDPNCSCHEAEFERPYTREDHLREERAYKRAKVQARLAEHAARQAL